MFKNGKRYWAYPKNSPLVSIYNLIMRKFVAFFDLHCGYEMRDFAGKRKKSPTHCVPAIKAALKFVEDFKPDTLLLVGDQLEVGSISRHNQGKPRLVEGMRLTDDMDALNKYILSPTDNMPFLKKRLWFKGNHENRVDRYLDENPSCENLIEPEVYLNLAKRGWTLVDEEVPYAIGKLHFVHGHSLFVNGGGTNPAAKLAYYYRRNIRAGHLHTYAVATDVTPADRHDYHTAIIVPAMSAATPDYMKNRPSNFQQGFLYGYVKPNYFNDYVINIHNGRFIAEGREYDGNKN